jgi:hypothetical protein
LACSPVHSGKVSDTVLSMRLNPCSYLVTLLEAALLSGTAWHCPHDVGKESPVTSGLAAHNSHSEASGCHITPQLQVSLMTTDSLIKNQHIPRTIVPHISLITNQHTFMYATVKEHIPRTIVPQTSLITNQHTFMYGTGKEYIPRTIVLLTSLITNQHTFMYGTVKEYIPRTIYLRIHSSLF